MSKTVSSSDSFKWLAPFRPARLLPTLLLCLLGFIFLIPVFWMLSLSLQSFQETIQNPLTLLPHHPQWGNYVQAFREVPLLLYMQNTLTITLAVVVGSTFSAAFCAYALARLRFRGRGLLFGIVLATLMLPPAVTLIPLYILFRNLHWINTFLPLTVPAFFGGGAFNIFLLRQFILTIPRELDEAALIDGANYWQIFLHLILPLCKPALTVVAVMTAVATWNDFLGPLIYLNTPDHFTMAVGLVSYAGNAGLYTNPQPQLLMAATVMMIAPILLVFIFAQRYIIQGIATTGIKG